MNDFTSLKLLDKCRGLFSKFGIDYGVMRNILQVKLTMDQRRVPTIFNQSKNKEGNQFLKSLGIYALYGLILIPFIVMGQNYMFQMSLVFGMVMFILMTSMISDFSTVLLDVRDKTILSTKPVNSRTISAAKMVHVSIYMTLLTGAFVTIPFVVSLAVQGILFSLLFLVELLFMELLIIVLTALIYIFILRFFNGERLKDIINYVQIILSVGIVIGYQILIRAFEFVDFSITFQMQWWHIFIPPIWFGAPFELLLNQNLTSYIIFYSILVVVVPILSIILYAKLTPSFERNLQKLLSNSGENKKKTGGMTRIWAKLVCSSKEERVFFHFASLMMGQEREFKLKVYPSLGFAFIFPFIFIFNELRMSSFAELSSSRMFVMIYFVNIMIPTVVHMLKFSGKYKGAWIYRAAPINNDALIYRATLKAFLFNLYIPIFALISVLFIGIFSVRILPDLIVVLLTGCLHALLSYKLMNNETYPFSQSFEFAQNTNTAKNILLMLVVVALGGFHFFLTTVPFGVYIYLVALLILNIIGWKLAFSNKSMKQKLSN